MGEHTRGPWRVDGEGVRAIIRGDDLTIVAVRHRLPGVLHEANAQFIVTACNNHAELVEALREALANIEAREESLAGEDAFVARARSLLSRIKGSENQ